MQSINLRAYYPWYTHDEFIEIPDEIAEAMLEAKRHERNYTERVRYHKAYYSLDCGDGIEENALYPERTPEQIYEYKFTIQKLCDALNSLPEAQGRRIDAFYMLGMKKIEIAQAEGVNNSGVCGSIKTGLRSMKKYLHKHL